MELKFKKGDIVKHKLGSQKMIFDSYQEKAPTKIVRNIITGSEIIETGPKEFTGKAWCTWLINNNETGGNFDVDYLEFLNI